MRALAILMLFCAVARADVDEPGAPAPVKPRGFHGSIAAGGALEFGSSDRWAGAAAIDVVPGGALDHWGVTVGVRDVGYTPFAGHGMATLGVLREAAAARPLLAIFLHGDVGVAWGDGTLPVFGGGVKTYLTALGPLGIALDTTVHVELDGVSGTHLVLGFGALIALIR